MSPSVLQPQAPLPSKSHTPHPYAPLSAAEITYASTLVKGEWPTGTEIQIKTLTLDEPPKKDAVPFIEAESRGQTHRPLTRMAYVDYYLRKTNKFHEAIINLSEQRVESNVRVGKNIHGAGDAAEIMAVEQVALADDRVQEALKELRLPQGAVIVADPWIYGSDGVADDERMYQCFLYMRNPELPDEPDSNHYAFPLPVSPVISTETLEVIRIDKLPTGSGYGLTDSSPYKPRPSNEYIPELQPRLRDDLKPLQVIQPEGVSFNVQTQGTSHVINWQKWSFRVGFNQREGMVVYNVRYDNRSLFHRLSLSDMNIPYADPRAPFHKKSAFDLGDVGAGTMANNLKLGCDCLGSIHYLSAILADSDGGPLECPNVMCLHEQDAGILWKHTNYRTGRAAVARNRELVLQSILTVANYEYVLAFVFNQAAELHYEIRATGILSTQPLDDDIETPTWGTRVHPGVLAPFHQHIFSLRIDPAIDGPLNRLVYTEAHAMPVDSELNPHGNGYTTTDTLITHSAALNTNTSTARTFKIANALATPNAVTGAAPAYKLSLPPFQKILSHPSSFNHARAEFADAALYAVKHRDGELYAGGKHTNQSRGGTGVRSWAARQEKIVDEDLVLYAQVGLQHVPRTEDFPVMPCEVLRIGLKPVGFFERNPAMDVRPSVQGFNRSVLVNGVGEAVGDGLNGDALRHRQVEGTGVVGENGRVEGTRGHARGVNGSCCE